ncbi:MAG TPA: hypothetical protein VLH61_01435 [Bacteroidales bacterium]|nr:hypothetical protein [Bacteroidales bacterium]
MRIISLAIFLVLVSALESNSQTGRRPRHIIFLGLGPTGFMGDLGGANQIGTQGIRDFDFQAMRPGIQAGYRFFIIHDLALSGRLSFGHVSGNDRHTLEPYRHNRNLSFRSQLLEISVNGELFFFSWGRMGARFINHAANTGWSGTNLRAYIFGGIGGFYFNPQGYFDREHYLTLQHASVTNSAFLPENGWFNLRRIGTEGQGPPGLSEAENYSPFNISFPMGFGVSISINRQWSIGVEYGFRATFTDYIDDVSTNYVDPSIFSARFPDDPARIALGEFFSNPTNYATGVAPTMPGEKRGNPLNRDAYMFMFFSLKYKFPPGLGSPWWVPFLR